MKNPTILEGGIARVFSGIRKLFTRQSGSDDMITWVPESDRQLTTKYITKNGVYRASDDGYYAYSSVTVSVSTDSGVTGEGDDGEQHYVAPDPDTGELVDTVIPSSIQVVTPPTNPYGIYKDGQAIGKDGMVVKAYLASGELYTGLPDGIVPNEEITLVPSNAVYDVTKDTGGGLIATIDDPYYAGCNPPIPAFHKLVSIADHVSASPNVYAEKTAVSDAYLVAYQVIGSNATSFLWLSTDQNASVSTETKIDQDGQGEGIYYGTIPLSYSGETNISGTTFYYNFGGDLGWGDEVNSIQPHVISSANNYVKDIATVIFDGESTQIPAGSTQTITAEWPRVGDGAVLSDTFEILVAPPIYGGGEA